MVTIINDEIDFNAPCPVQSCLNKTAKYQWVHAHCGGKQKLNSNGELRCSRCNRRGLFVDWKFDCGDHDYEYASCQGILHAFTILSQIAVGPSQQLWLARTSKNIMEQFEKQL